MIPFTSSDVWLLTSIALAENEAPVRLPDILFAGDAINKAVFTPQELRRGLSKLTQAGYVSDADGIYSLTEQGRALIADARQHTDNWRAIRRHIEKRLTTATGAEDAPRFEDVRFPYPAVTDEAVGKAIKQSHAKFARWLKAAKERDP